MIEGHANRNAAEGVSIKVDKRDKTKLKIGEDIPSLDEMRRFQAVLDDPWRPFFLTAIYTGMRASELRGLRWVNVDFEKRELYVRERADRFNQMGRPKSASGERTIPLPLILVNVLRRWKLVAPKGDLGLVFPSATGHIRSLSNIRQWGLIPLMKKAGIVDAAGGAKYSGLHSLRHFHASLLINPPEAGGLGLPPKAVQERLGHATLAQTLDVYSHLFPRTDDAEQMRRLERALTG